MSRWKTATGRFPCCQAVAHRPLCEASVRMTRSEHKSKVAWIQDVVSAKCSRPGGMKPDTQFQTSLATDSICLNSGLVGLEDQEGKHERMSRGRASTLGVIIREQYHEVGVLYVDAVIGQTGASPQVICLQSQLDWMILFLMVHIARRESAGQAFTRGRPRSASTPVHVGNTTEGAGPHAPHRSVFGCTLWQRIHVCLNGQGRFTYPMHPSTAPAQAGVNCRTDLCRAAADNMTP